jgi:hypothetical protein
MLLTMYTALTAGFLLLLILIVPSIRSIGPTEVGLVTKRFGIKTFGR